MSPSDFLLPALATALVLSFLALGGVLASSDSSSKALSTALEASPSSSSSLSGLARFLLATAFGLAGGFVDVCAVFFREAFVVVAFFAGLALGFYEI
jgi:hypothetical protein